MCEQTRYTMVGGYGAGRSRAMEVEAMKQAGEGKSVGFLSPDGFERFAVDNDVRATWAVGKLNSMDEEIQRVKAQAETMLKRLEKDRADFLERFEDDLRAWLTTKLEGGTKRSVDLLTGRIGFRKKPGGLKVVDKDAAFDWCIKNAPPDLDLIRETVTYSVDKEQLKALHASTGEIPSGCEVAEDSDTLYVRGGK